MSQTFYCKFLFWLNYNKYSFVLYHTLLTILLLDYSAEPLKKKKKIDPAVIRAREDRRRKKLEKQIRRLEKHAKQMKPIAEIDLSLTKKAELE